MSDHTERYRQICKAFQSNAKNKVFTEEHLPRIAQDIAKELKQCVELTWFDDETRKELEELLSPYLQ